MKCTDHRSNPSPASAREHFIQVGNVTGHWMVDTGCGRDLLVSRFRLLQPHQRLSVLHPDAQLVHAMERMIEELGFRHWAPPRTRMQRARAALLLVAYNLRAGFGLGAPDWRSRFAQGRS